MYIRRTLTRTLANGAQYYSHRLVRSERIGGRVRQVTLLNLGSDFTVGAAQWQALCARVEGLLAGEGALSGELETPAVELEAQRVAALLLARQSRAVPRESGAPELVDLGTLKVSRWRSVGVEQVGLWAIQALRLPDQLRGLGMPQRQIAAVLGLIVARMGPGPTGQAARQRWAERSALGELLGVDFQAFDPSLPGRAGASLLRHRKALEAYLAARLGELAGEPGAERRFCLVLPWMQLDRPADPEAASRRVLGSGTDPGGQVLGLACDRHGFVQRSVSVPAAPSWRRSIGEVLDGLAAPASAAVVHAGGADPSAVRAWLLDQGYRPWTDAGTTDDHAGACDQGIPGDLDAVFGWGARGCARVAGWHEADADADDGDGDAAALFIAVLAYQCVRLIRHRLQAQGIGEDWRALHEVLGQHCRVTISLIHGDGRTLHLRQPTSAEPGQLAIYHALGTDPVPGGVQRTLV